jgi:hypothetical protein
MEPYERDRFTVPMQPDLSGEKAGDWDEIFKTPVCEDCGRQKKDVKVRPHILAALCDECTHER